MKPLIALLLTITLCGCGMVGSLRPVGDSPTNIQDKQDEWAGTWLSPDSIVSIDVVDATNGVLEVALCMPDQGKWNCQTGTFYLRDGGGWSFANYEFNDGTNEIAYLWGKVEKDTRQILFWLPDTEKIKALVEAGKLPGTIEYPKKKGEQGKPAQDMPFLGYTITLGELTPEHFDLITSETNGVMVYWQAPIALLKQSQRHDPRYLRSAQKRLLRDWS